MWPVVVLPGRVAVARLGATSELPGWAARPSGPLWTVTRTDHETSVTCDAAVVPADTVALRGLRVLALASAPHPDAIGVLAGLTAPLAAAGVWVLAICTYDTDHLLVREQQLELAFATLPAAKP